MEGIKQKHILYKLASRERPNKLLNCISNISTLQSNDKDYTILLTLDEDDDSMFNQDMILRLNTYRNVKYYFGKSKSKVDAINRDMDKSGDWDILVNMSDDMEFIVNGFDNIIRKDIEPNIVLHYDDGNINGKKIMTMSIMDRVYYKSFNYIYYPGYDSFYCDNEATEVAELLGRRKVCSGRLFNHNHYTEGKGSIDELYRKNNAKWAHDEAVYNERKKMNFWI